MKRTLFPCLLIILNMCISFAVQAQHKITPKIGYIDWEKNTVNVGPDVQEGEMITDVYLPLQ